MPKREPRGLLLTGAPGSGKTTVLRRVAERLSDLPIRGFLTREIRQAGERVGFRIETFDGDSAVFAHVRIQSPHRVSKYGVDLPTLDRVVEEQLERIRSGVVLIDEIGKMECLSPRFVEAVKKLLDSSAVVVATVALRGEGLIASVKRRPGLPLWSVSRAERDDMPARVEEWARSALGRRTSAS
jgi:nucleoside-triphosphatase